jgi:hypothetical protein
VLEVVQSETCSARAGRAAMSRRPARRDAGRRRLGVRSRRRVFPRSVAPSQCSPPSQARAHAENARCSVPPYVPYPPRVPTKAGRVYLGATSSVQRSKAGAPVALKGAAVFPRGALDHPAAEQSAHAIAGLCTPRRVLPAHPFLWRFGRGPVPSTSPSRLPNLPSTTAPVSQDGASPDRAAPRPGRLGATGRPCTGNFPPICGHKPVVREPLNLLHPSPSESLTGVSQFRRAAPAGPPRDHIAKLEFFSRASLQLVTQIVKVFWLFLVN